MVSWGLLVVKAIWCWYLPVNMKLSKRCDDMSKDLTPQGIFIEITVVVGTIEGFQAREKLCCIDCISWLRIVCVHKFQVHQFLSATDIQPGVCSTWEIFSFRFSLLPPANEVCEGYVFTGLCLSTEGVCMEGGHAWQGRCAWWGGHAWQGTLHGRYYEVRSMTGWYASYWNAFLFALKCSCFQ